MGQHFNHSPNQLRIAKLQMIEHDLLCTLTPFSLTFQVGLEVQYWPHKSGARGSTPVIGRDLFNF